ncbi:MAG: ATP-binding protein [Anaeromyxobacteraceae bacterium]
MLSVKGSVLLEALNLASREVIWVFRQDGALEYVSRSWRDYSGLDLAATRRDGWERAVEPEDLPSLRTGLDRASREHALVELGVRLRGRDGAFHGFHFRLVPLLDGECFTGLLMAGVDEDAARSREAVLLDELAAKDRLAKVAASVPGVVCSFRLAPDGTVSMPLAAPGMEEVYGLPAATLARDMRPVFERIPPDDLAEVSERIERSRRELTPWHARFRYDHPTRGLRWLDGTSIPSREPDGGTLWHGYVGDVTEHVRTELELRARVAELRRAQEALLDADRRKNDFLGVLSHELRNPLAPIQNALHLVERSPADGEVARRARMVVRRQVQHLTRLVDDLLDLTRISRGKVRIQRSVLDLRDVVRAVTEDHAPLLERAGLAHPLTLPAAPVRVNVDAERVSQVVGNLLQNAEKFTPPGGSVAVSLREEGGRAVLTVEDTGIGMEPALVARMFEPFAQGEGGPARVRGGLGLGLALSKGLVELQGGTVSASSGGPGRGSRFTVSFPVDASPPGPEPTAAPPPGRCRHPHRVLVVEDNLDAAQTLADVLSLEGHEVQLAPDGATGIGMARSLHPDVVLCDIGLPDMDGYEVARAMRSDPALQGVRLIAVSGYTQPEDRERGRAAGFDAQLPKPAPLDQLQALIEAAPRAPTEAGAHLPVR